MTVASTPVEEYLGQLGSTSAVPGGGSAAALAGAMGVALLGMVAALSARKGADPAERERLSALAPELEQLRGRLLQLSQDDIDAYRAVLDARKRKAPPEVLNRASARAAEVPLETARACDRALSIFSDVSPTAWEVTRSDLNAGGALLAVGLRAALANVAVNLPDLDGATRTGLEAAYRALQAKHPGPADPSGEH
ncbi:MAG: cyclodeaminase/cyclohydrolase family protein [Candidatus Dormibacteraeota bacterium]|nr:cyclodeaminase/cyclohydrolase family protein [Candidatus Dormibacteraeota bacterium]